MKQVMRVGMGIWMVFCSSMVMGQAKVDEKRMEQDIEVAENILSTLIRQQSGKRNFFPMEVEGSYLSGYGVTFRLPDGPFMFIYDSDFPGTVNIRGGGSGEKATYSYSYSRSHSENDGDERDNSDGKEKRTPKARTATKVVNSDSLRNSVNGMLVDVAKTFLADYGNLINQLKPEEKIAVTNRSDEFHNKYALGWNGNRRAIVSVEAKYDDINQLKLGRITRDQFMSRLKVVNAETTEEVAPDLEVFSSMFGRLYQQDLSTTFYSDNNIGYERLKDFGVIYYMRVYSSSEERENRFHMPTQNLRDLSQEERDNKVKELYPKFESELKENLVEYGRTVRSLKDDEQLNINVKLTKCTGCGIPATLELSIKGGALKDYGSGKATREATIAKISVKKGGTQ